MGSRQHASTHPITRARVPAQSGSSAAVSLPWPAAARPMAAARAAALGVSDATRARPVPLLADWAWQALAACRSEDPDLFFHPDGERDPARAERERAAKAACARCPVVRECAAQALTLGERYGVWGGLSEDEREQLLARPPS